MSDFHHERLDVYKAAIDFLALSEEIAGRMQKGRAYLVDQLRRAALSVSLNVAEGAGEFAYADKARFYRMARRSGTQCVAILDACRRLKLTDDALLRQGRELLHRVVSMLTAMVVRLSGTGTGTGTGTVSGTGTGSGEADDSFA